MNQQTLWAQLIKSNVTVTDTQPAVFEVDASKPWYIRFLQGFSGWIASWFVLGFLAAGLFELIDNPVAIGLVGVCLSLGPMLIYRQTQHSDFLQQVLLVFSLAGQLCVAFALFEGMGFFKSKPLLYLALYQTLLFAVMNNYLHRLLSATFAIAAVLYGLFDYAVIDFVYLSLVTAFVSAAFVGLWMKRGEWGRWSTYFAPLAVALSVVLLFLGGTQVAELNWQWMFSQSASDRTYFKEIKWASQLLLGLVWVYLLHLIWHENAETIKPTLVHKLLAVILVGVTTFLVPGLAVAMLMLCVGIARQSRWLQVIGMFASLGFISWFYYDLSVTLWVKSISLLVLGVLFSAAYFLIFAKSGLKEKLGTSSVYLNLNRWVVIVAVLLCFAAVNHAIWKKEVLLKTGKVFYLPLAPKDPRSLMQGDYMRLNFALSRTINTQNLNVDVKNEGLKDGFVVLDLADNLVASFNSNYQGQVLNGSQVKLHYRVRKHQVKIGAESFFFQEGQANIFDTAAFGEFVVTEGGEVMLKALRDKDLKLLGLNRLD